jgi:Leucine-rich repeat (LRR) protein
MESVLKSTRRINEIDELIQYEMTKQDIEDIDIENDEFLSENYLNIQKLNLSSNKFNEITRSFLKFENLILLDISYNQITKIENIKNCVNLEVLLISHNELKTLGVSLAPLKKLQHCDLSYNKLYITNSTIKSFQYNQDLISLSLQGNMNYDFEKFSYKCLDELMNLEYLDNFKIFAKKDPKIKSVPVKIEFAIGTGEKKKVKTLKEYIKVKRNDINENYQFYNTTAETKENLAKNKNQNKYENTTSYYYLNKSIK